MAPIPVINNDYLSVKVCERRAVVLQKPDKVCPTLFSSSHYLSRLQGRLQNRIIPTIQAPSLQTPGNPKPEALNPKPHINLKARSPFRFPCACAFGLPPCFPWDTRSLDYSSYVLPYPCIAWACSLVDPPPLIPASISNI